MNLIELESVRGLMAEEVQHDIAAGALYRSKRMTDSGWAKYPALLLEAAQNHDAPWLASQIESRGLLAATETRNVKGKITTAKVPSNAASVLAEGEFNRFYIRGVCRDVIAQGGSQVKIYRAKPASQPRPESQARIGKLMSVESLLTDLRKTNEVDKALQMPPGPNSGLSVCRVG